MKNSIDLQKKHYDKTRAENFDKKRINANHLYKIEVIEEMFEQTFAKRGLRVMEVGGGTGIHALHFMQKESKLIDQFIFSDLSKEMLEVAKRKLSMYEKLVKYVCCEAESFRLEEKVDCIYISGSMHHFSDPEQAVFNCKKWLKKNGILIICEPIITNPYAWPRVLVKKEEHGQFYVTKRNVKKWLNNQGFLLEQERVLHYRSNKKYLQFILKLEKVKILNWLGVMFVMKCKLPD